MMRRKLLLLALALLAPAAWAVGTCHPSCTSLGNGLCRCPASPVCEGFGCDCKDQVDSANPSCKWRTGRTILFDPLIEDDFTKGYCSPGDANGGLAPMYCSTSSGYDCTTNTIPNCSGAGASVTCGAGFDCILGAPGSVWRALPAPTPRYVFPLRGGTMDTTRSILMQGDKFGGLYFAGQASPGDVPTFRTMAPWPEPDTRLNCNVQPSGACSCPTFGNFCSTCVGGANNGLGCTIASNCPGGTCTSNMGCKGMGQCIYHSQDAGYSGMTISQTEDVWLQHFRMQRGSHATFGTATNPPNTLNTYVGTCSAANRTDNLFMRNMDVLFALDDPISFKCAYDLNLSYLIVGEGVDGDDPQEYRKVTGSPHATDCTIGSSGCTGSSFAFAKGMQFGIGAAAPGQRASIHHSLLHEAEERIPKFNSGGAGSDLLYVQFWNNLTNTTGSKAFEWNSFAHIKLDANYWRDVVSNNGSQLTALSGTNTKVYTSTMAVDIVTTTADTYCGSLASPQTGHGGCVRVEPGASYTTVTDPADASFRPPVTNYSLAANGWPAQTIQTVRDGYAEVLARAGAGGGIGKRDMIAERIVYESWYRRCANDLSEICSSDSDCATSNGSCTGPRAPYPCCTSSGNGSCGSDVEDCNTYVPNDGARGCGDGSADGDCRTHSPANDCCSGDGAGEGSSSGTCSDANRIRNSACTHYGSPWVCCTGSGTGVCGDGDSSAEANEHYPACCLGAGYGFCDWPVLNPGTPITDTDRDGIADWWEASKTVAEFVDNTGCTATDTPWDCCTGNKTGTCGTGCRMDTSAFDTNLERIGSIGDAQGHTAPTDCNKNGFPDVEDYAIELGEPGVVMFAGGTCGNSSIETGEECDDGNGSNTDACVAGCQDAECGDGYTWSGVEQCDDGNSINTDSCANDCLTNTCGDGDVDAGETCDTAGESASCDPDCTSVSCGDGYRNLLALEGCDDGNTSNGDGCSSACLIESSTCGNGIPEPGEECDDGNTDDGDGCDSECRFEDADCTTILTNGNFASTPLATPWFFFTDADATAVIDTGEVKITTTTPGSNVQLFHRDVALTGAALYRLSFDCRVPVGAREIRMNVIKHTTPFTGYVLEGQLRRTCGTTTTSHTITYTTTSGDKTDGRLQFLIGNTDVAGDVHYFDNVVLCEIAPPNLCGDGDLDGEEACDDGNAESGDGCSSTCDIETGGTLIISELRRDDIRARP